MKQAEYVRCADGKCRNIRADGIWMGVIKQLLEN
jgi:hypothetical protein